jgi:uncharacterized membrane protein
MDWDLGLRGVAVLLVMSLAFGVFTQLVFWGHATRWLWLVAAAVMFAVGALISEVWFGWATEADLQPNIEGLSLDETLLGFAIGVAVVLAARAVVWRRGHRPATT